jgi:hypothetical protein
VSDQPPLYVNNTTLSARVGKLNPQWNQPGSNDVLDSQFQKAMELTGGWSAAPAGCEGGLQRAGRAVPEGHASSQAGGAVPAAVGVVWGLPAK